MKKSIIKNISLGIACLLGVGGAIAAASIFNVDKPFEEARADDAIVFIYRYWNEGKKEVSSGSINLLTYTPVTSTTTSWTSENWYVVNSDVTISNRVTVTGDVHLFLCDGATLTTSKGINVNSGNTLNIYSQSNDSGKLVSTVGSDSLGAAIGGNDKTNGGAINIHGGDIESTGSKAAAAIGGGANGGAGGTISIYGGKVTANAYSGDGVAWASGIGGGSNGAGGTISIYGGTVNAYGTTGGAGIGGGWGSSAAGGTITIYGGIVNATSSGTCAAIGGGPGASGGEITIYGGIITATNTASEDGDAAGIGGGYYATGGSVTISGGIVTATGGSDDANGIGGGKSTTGKTNVTLTVNNGLDVLGSNEHEPTISDIQTDYSTNRWRYMIVKDTRHIHDDITFSPWTSSDSLPTDAGSYYLTTDVTLTNKGWNVPGDVNLCLNDHIITVSSSDWQHCIDLRYSTNPKTLNLYDEPHTTRYWINDSESDYRFHGKIVSQSEYNSYTGYKGTFVGGAITSNTIDNSQRTLYVQSSNIFNMYGGNIVGSYGHAIEAQSTSNITINGGKITGSSIAIYSDTSGNITINGGEISGNQNGIRSTNPTGPINLNGGKISDTDSIPYESEAVSGCVINYNGTELLNNKCDFRVNSNFGYLKLEKPLPENSTYKIMCAQDGVFTKNWSTYMGEADPTEYFECYYENKTVERDGDEVAYRTIYTITYDGNDATSGTVPDPEVYISGRTATIAGNTGNLEKEDLVFTGWNTKADGTGDSYKAGSSMTVTATTTLYAQWSDHLHNFSYSSEGNTITATCDNADNNCPLPNHQATLTISAPSGSLIYDGTAKGATYVDTSSGVAFSNINITYINPEDPSFSGVPTDAGAYTALISFNESSLRASIQYDILKANVTYTAPTGKENLSYSGSEQDLVVAGSATGGTMQYKLGDNGVWSEEVPTATNAGTYNVYYKVVGDDNHNDVNVTDPIVVTIAKIAPTQVDPTAKTGLIYTGSAQDLINAGSSTDGTMKYKLGDNGVWSEDIPSAINAGEYTVYYKVFGDQNHEDSTEQSLVVSIAKTQAVLTAPTGKSGLNYIGEDQVLINAGSSTFGEALYKVNDGEYSASLPEGKNVGNYTIYYKVESTDNYDGVAEASITVSVAENNKEALVNAINNTDSYYDNIKDKYDIFANDVQDAINKANEVSNNPNVTEAEIAKAIEELNNAITKAQNDVTKIEETIETINKIGDVKYDTESKDAINAARKVYDGLTDEQKDQLGEDYINILTNAETKYASEKKTADILFIVLLIVSSLVLIGGIWFLIVLAKKRKKDDDDENNHNGSASKKEPVKAMSIGGFLPFVILTSQYLKMPWIIVYIIAGLAILVWISVLIVAIVKKNKKQAVSQKSSQIQSEVKPVEESKPVETVKEPEPVKPAVIAKEPEPVNEEEEEVITITDEKGNVFNIRFIKSFTAKLIQSPDETKKYYEELKNYVLSYKKTNSRVSWHYDSINSGRNQVLKFAIRGKTLCLYYPLNVEDYNDTKYKVEAVESKKFEEVPCLYRIKNDRRLGYAKDLIDTVMNNLGLVKGEEQHEVYSDLPYEPNKPLISRGLIKELKVQVNKPVEQVVSKKVNDEGDEIVTTRDNKGNYFEIRYIKSFLAKLSQASDETKAYYNELKNYVLTYKGAHSRVSWHFDSINVGRNQVIKFSIRGKTLCVYYALNANDYLDTKYKVEAVDSKKFEEVPCLYRIKNDRRRDYAKDLIDTVMANVPTIKGKESNEDFRIPYESTKALLAKGLIKENKVQVSKQEEQVIESHEDEEGNEVVLSQDNAGNVYETRYVKSFRARLIEANEEAKDYYKELRDYILSYQDVDESISWLYDSINYNREQLFKLNIRGKTLCIYYALDTSKVGEKYKVENSDTKKYSKVPCLYRISNPRRVKLAKELIDRVMRKHKLILGEEYHDTYHLKNKSRDELIKKGLIKEVKILIK
ncbi:MAG: hypothetical protein E7175_04140 [Erysipelotrichaceae bacterium]|nr:hypothetical protein [Erysipelotrichaceae bacterium]